ncbi:MAG TPA: prolipoprotein diacylglyceryl transferase [bacterium]|nr:prolipoprotein diacylglyceryl transferase [bacterium]
MFNFLHIFNPSPIMFSFGVLRIYWYGFFIVLGVFLALLMVVFLAKKYKINKDDILDLSFYLFIFGIIGARIYDIFLEWRYYLQHPIDTFKIWEGGLAIHGGILAGILVIYFFIKYKKIKNLGEQNLLEKFFLLSSLVVVGVSLGQAIGRWGNYFNQELFGRPTNNFLKMYIDPNNRPLEYLSESWFHPTFLYESIGCLIIFFILVGCHWYFLKKKKNGFKSTVLIVSLYLVLYSVLRFSLEFVRIDFAPTFIGLRWPQVMSLILILITIWFNIKIYFEDKLKYINKK